MFIDFQNSNFILSIVNYQFSIIQITSDDTPDVLL